jgi:hypothetical protein
MAWANADWITQSTAALRLSSLQSHIAEVSAAIQAAVSADGVSHNSQVLGDYLKTLTAQLGRYERAASGGIFVAGRLR